MKKRRLLGVVLALLCLYGCGKGIPIPHDKVGYVGEWETTRTHADSESGWAPRKDMSLSIAQDGDVTCRWITKTATRTGGIDVESTNFSGRLQRFEGEDFFVTWFPLFGPVKFVVSGSPHAEQGRWKMVVDGFEVTKVQ